MAAVRLVLSGGSAKGLLEATGAAAAVEDRGHTISVGAGTSAGGIVVGALASGRAPSELRHALMEQRLDRFVSPKSWRAWVRLALRGSLSDGSALAEFLEDFTRGRTFAEAHFDARITASDYSAGRARVFSRHTDPDMPLALAMRATSALPLAFPAVPYRGRWFKDGGIYGSVPVEAGIRALGERLVIFALAPAPGGCENGTAWGADVGLVREAGRAVDLLVDANVEAELAKAPEGAVKVFSDGLGFGTLDFDLTALDKQELYEHGYGLMHVGLEEAGL